MTSTYNPRATTNRNRDLLNVTRFMVERCRVINTPERGRAVTFCDELYTVYTEWTRGTRVGPFLHRRTFINLVRDVIRGTGVTYGVVRRVSRDTGATTARRHTDAPGPAPDTTITRRGTGAGVVTVTDTDTTSVRTGDVITDTVRTTRVVTTIRRGFSGLVTGGAS